MPSYEFIHRAGSVWEQFPFPGKELPEIREGMEEFVIQRLRPYDDVTWTNGTCGAYTGKWVTPAREPMGLMFYIHGGGFTLGSSGIPMPFLLELSHRLNISCFSLDYRMAPEDPFPASTEDVLGAYKALLEMGYDPAKMIVCGESAGATLALVLVHMAQKEGLPLPAGVVALSPVTDALPEVERDDKVVLENLPDTDHVWKVYAPGADLRDPRISPARGELSYYPPVFLSAGGTEPLMADALLFTRRAARAGVDVRLHVGKDMIHTYPLDLWDYPEAMVAFEEIQLFVAQQLK